MNPTVPIALFALLCVGFAQANGGLVGYDCEHVNSTVEFISMTRLEKCSPKPISNKLKHHLLQIVKQIEMISVNYIHCRVKRRRVSYYCGWRSYMSYVFALAKKLGFLGKKWSSLHSPFSAQIRPMK